PFPYLDPISHRITLAVFCSVFSIVFLNLFEPFDLDSWTILKDYNSRFPILLFALVGLTFLLLSQLGIRRLLNLGTFNLGSFSLCFAGEILFLSIVNHFFFGDHREAFDEMLYEFGLTLKYTFLVLIIPYGMMLLYFASRTNTPNEEEKEKNLDMALPEQLAPLILKSENEKELLSIKASHLLFLKSESNYVAVFHLKNGELKKQLLRTSLKKLAQEIKHPQFLRVHRSYMVNISQLISVNRNTKAYELILEKADKYPIPVSPTYMEAFDEKLNMQENRMA
ncbi:MAG: LytTR family DNA-binding domain-containing protein, partial [Bacteroidota bacterium]